MQHSSADIEAAASALANQISAGIKMREAVARMAKLQPKHADMWNTASELLSRGGRLSTVLSDYWPEGVVAAVKAGEESDALGMVFKRTAEAMVVKAQVRKIYGKLTSPLVAFGAGFGVFLFFMVAVIPKLQSSLGGGEGDLTFRLAMLLHHVFTNFWPLVAAGAGALVFAMVWWLKQPSTVDTLVDWGDQVPGLQSALRSLYFGLWAHQVALLDSAGLPVRQQLLLSAKTLPRAYQEGVFLMAEEVLKRGIADSADPDKQAEGDPRQIWPFYIATAFITAHETGQIDQEMKRCAPVLIDDGMRKLTQVMTVADLVAKVLAAAMIGFPLTSYFMQLSSSLTNAFG